MEKRTEAKEPYEKVCCPKSEIIFNNFLGGIAWGLGTLVGATIIIGLLGFLFSQVNLIPIIGSWVAQVVEVVNQYRVK